MSTAQKLESKNADGLSSKMIPRSRPLLNILVDIRKKIYAILLPGKIRKVTRKYIRLKKNLDI